MTSAYNEYKKSLLGFNCHVFDDGADLSESVFWGCYIAIAKENKLICAIPFYCDNRDFQHQYRKALHSLKSNKISFKKGAVYLDINTKKYFFVYAQSRCKYSLPNRLMDISVDKTSNPFSPKCRINVEKEQDVKEQIGWLIVQKKRLVFSPVIMFDTELFKPLKSDIRQLMVFRGGGEIIEGNSDFFDGSQCRILHVTYLSESFARGREIKAVMYKHEVDIEKRSRNKFSRKDDSILINNRFFKQIYCTADPINFDWFGLEYGFTLTDKSKMKYRFISNSLLTEINTFY